MLWLLGGCGSPTTPTPPPPPTDTLTIACPAPVSAQSIDGSAVAVSFAAPTTTGGKAPVTTTCTPASGTNFPVSTTSVTCTAKDAVQQSASCGVAVTVTKVPRFSVTAIDAFGDSITEGGIPSCSGSGTFGPVLSMFDLADIRPAADRSRSYPTKLQTLMTARYTVQNVQVKNLGLSGEMVVNEGVDRFRRDVLYSVRPQVVLLQEGANDIGQSDFSRNEVVNGLREMVRKSRDVGIQVYVGTLLPQRAGGCRASGGGPDEVVPVNDLIRGMAASEGAVLVDLYAAFGGVPGDLIGLDGLHPTDAGYEKIAATFFDALRQRLEY